MRRALVWAVLGAIFFICFTGRAQNPPAGQRPAQGNQPAGASGNPPQQTRGPAPPVQGPPHDPHDLTGVWNARRGYGGGSYVGWEAEVFYLGVGEVNETSADNGGPETTT